MLGLDLSLAEMAVRAPAPRLPVPWTPAELASDIVGWWDAGEASTLTISGGLVAGWASRIGGVSWSQANMVARPPYTAADARAGGRPSVGASSAMGMIGLATGTLPRVSQIFMVAAYGNGTATTFAENAAFLGTVSGPGGARVLGATGSAALFASNVLTNTARVNGADAKTATILPLPLSTLQFDVSATMDWVLGFSASNGNRVWNGPICEVLFLGTALSYAARVRLEGYLAAKWGTQARLPPSHPFAAAPPRV